MARQADLTLCAVATGMLLQVGNSLGQTLPSAPAGDENVATAYEVIVTGSNIPTSEEVGPNPVDTYRRSDIERLGAHTISDLVERLPIATGASLNENRTNGGDGRTEINLRGILPKETLVLVDGRRVAPVGFAGDTVDLNTIPLGLVDHIDILKDGASAIYGTDAIDGVVNVWLIHRFRGLEVSASYGNTNLGFANDMAAEEAYLLAGTGDDKTDIVVYADGYNRGAIYSRDADISHDADYSPFGGMDQRSPFYAGRVLFFQYLPSLNGGALSPTPHAYRWPGVDPQYVVRTLPGIPARPNPILGRERILLNVNDLTAAMGPADRQFFYSSFDRKICDKYLEFFSDFKYARTFWQGDLGPAPFFPDVFTDATHPQGITPEAGISVPLQNAFNPFTGPGPFIYTSPGGFDPRVPPTAFSAAPPGTRFVTGVGYTALEAGPHTAKILTQNYLVTDGLRGNLGEFGDYFERWNWEMGFRYNEDDRLELVDNVINPAALRAALLDSNPATAFNPFGLNQNKPSVLKRIFVTTQRTGHTSLILQDFKLNGELFNLPAGPLAFAIGTEHRTEHANDIPDALTASAFTNQARFTEQTTAIGVQALGPTQGSRDVWSTWWELRIPVTSPVWNIPAFYSLELVYQERYENYSDFGDTERPKFCFRWQPIDSAFTVRGTYTEAFHAPTLRDLFETDRFTFPIIQADPMERPLIIGQQLIGGNPKTQPETAYEWTYGAIVTPGKWWSGLQNLTVTADFYHIDVRGIITSLDPLFLFNHSSQFPGQVIPGTPGTVQLITTHQNLGRFIEEGWDYEAVYSLATAQLGHGDFGTVTATLNGTYLQRAVLQAVPGSKEKNVVGKFGAGFEGTDGGGSFTHNRWYASLFYDGPNGTWMQGIDCGVTVHYIGQYWDNAQFTFFNNKPRNPTASPDDQIPIGQSDRKVREWITLDCVLNYTFNLSPAVAPNEVAGYAKDGGKSYETKFNKEKSITPVSTAEYNPCGWRAWLNNTTITVGMNNVFDEQPPFVAAAFENGYDESTANIKGRTWYVALKKRF